MELKAFWSEHKTKIIGISINTILYPLISLIAGFISNPVNTKYAISFSVVIPVISGYLFGSYGGGITGFVGGLVTYGITTNLFDLITIIPYTCMGFLSGMITKRFKQDWASALTVIFGYALNKFSLWLFHLFEPRNFPRNELLLSVFAEMIIDYLFILFYVELYDVFFRKKSVRVYFRNKKFKIAGICAICLWFFMISMLFLQTNMDASINYEFIASSFVVPALLISIFYNRFWSVMVASISSFLIGIILIYIPEESNYILTQKIIFRLFFLNFASLLISNLKDRYSKAEKKLHFLITKNPIATIELDRETGIQEWNPAAERLFGFPFKEVRDRNIIPLIFSVEQRSQFFQSIKEITSNKSNNHVNNHTHNPSQIYQNYTKNGKIIYCEWIGTPLLNYHGEIEGVSFLVQDVSSRMKNLQDEIQTQKIMTLEIIAGTICHDFNNILAQILGNISLIEEDAYFQANRSKILKTLTQAVQDASSLNSRLLNFMKSSQDNVETCSIVDLLNETLDLIIHKSAVDYNVVVLNEIPPMRVNSVQIRQTFCNLIINALDSMAEKKKLDITIQRITKASDPLNVIGIGEFVFITIKDYGTGIDKNLQDHIFSPYFTTKTSGNGLGLVSCNYIVQRHHGHITFESEVGLGTSFYIYLPIEN